MAHIPSQPRGQSGLHFLLRKLTHHPRLPSSRWLNRAKKSFKILFMLCNANSPTWNTVINSCSRTVKGSWNDKAIQEVNRLRRTAVFDECMPACTCLGYATWRWGEHASMYVYMISTQNGTTHGIHSNVIDSMCQVQCDLSVTTMTLFYYLSILSYLIFLSYLILSSLPSLFSCSFQFILFPSLWFLYDSFWFVFV